MTLKTIWDLKGFEESKVFLCKNDEVIVCI